MDQLLQQLKQLTERMTSNLDTALYEVLEDFVAERQQIVDAIGAAVDFCPLSSEQKDILARIMSHDPAIIAKMNAHRLDALDGLQKRSQAKVQRNAYESAYTPDSILMDRKK